MRKVLSLNQQMEDLYCVSIDGSKFSDTNEEEVDKMRDMLSHAMRYTLTEKQKNCLSMYYFDKMTMKEQQLWVLISPPFQGTSVRQG